MITVFLIVNIIIMPQFNNSGVNCFSHFGRLVGSAIHLKALCSMIEERLELEQTWHEGWSLSANNPD